MDKRYKRERSGERLWDDKTEWEVSLSRSGSTELATTDHSFANMHRIGLKDYEAEGHNS